MSDQKNDKKAGSDTIINEMMTRPDDKPSSGLAGLVVEPEASAEKDSFEIELERTLKQTENEVLGLKNVISGPDQTVSWQKAREVVQAFRPVPWFIWRISNYVLGTPGQMNSLNEGFVLGLRRLLFAAASDPILGSGDKVNDLRKALKIVPPDVIAAVSVIHGVCRRLATRQFERIWRPILEDAILRCQIGWNVGSFQGSFGSGRGMLAGFASRSGLAILLSTGDLDQARKALESLASGKEISEVGLQIYQCDPLQVSAMMLSAAGCGRDASFGTVSYAFKDTEKVVENDEQLRWLAAFSVTENIRMGKVDSVPAKFWEVLGISESGKKDLLDITKRIIRRGHGWNWIV